MFRVNSSLFSKVITRVIISLSLFQISIFITGRVSDVAAYTGGFSFTAVGERTRLAESIFKILPTYGNIILSVLLITFLSSTLIFTFLNKYINKENYIDWYLLLYLPSLLIYASTPTKEFLFFFPAVLYIILESEYLIKKNTRLNTLLLFIIKILLLWFMFTLRGSLSYPYLALGIIIILFKIFNINFLKIRYLRVTNLCIYSFLICIFILIFTNNNFVANIANYLNSDFNQNSSLSRSFDIDLINNIYNPFNLIKIQFLSFFPSIKETLIKPHAFLITYESSVFLYLFFKSWQNLFSIIKNNNQAKLIYGLIFICIVCSYFLLYGMLGYMNVGSSQRFKSNLVPISLIFPNISIYLIFLKLSSWSMKLMN